VISHHRRRLRGKARRITIDMDPTDDPTHGQQELAFYNGHYDDHARRVHGDHPRGVRIDLTSQVLPTIFGTGTGEQVTRMYSAVQRYLRNPGTGGLRLCSDFAELKLDFGRVSGFTYGYKEHGGIWNQQNAMYLYGLYRRGRVREGYHVFQDLYRLVMDSGQSKVLPGIPSYFDKFGRGAFCYLTGSATWLTLSLLTLVYGVRGQAGDLVIHPRLVREQFGDGGRTGVACRMARFSGSHLA
jgi:cellobiose phosphorylase